jgi:hypothetical protein
MQIQLDPKQMDYLRRQAEAMEKIAAELAKLRKLLTETAELRREQARKD